MLGIGTRRDLEHHPKVGASWEGYAVEEVLKALRPDEAYFWGTHIRALRSTWCCSRGGGGSESSANAWMPPCSRLPCASRSRILNSINFTSCIPARNGARWQRKSRSCPCRTGQCNVSLSRKVKFHCDYCFAGPRIFEHVHVLEMPVKGPMDGLRQFWMPGIRLYQWSLVSRKVFSGRFSR